MSHYSEEDKQKVKDFTMDKISKKLDEALVHLEKSYEYDPYRAEIWIDAFNGKFELHFVPANELNDGQNYSLYFDYFERGK